MTDASIERDTPAVRSPSGGEVTGPLALAVFERYYLADDRPGHPTVFPVEARFRGPLDRAALQEALAATVARHPMLRMRLAGPESQPYWMPGEAPKIQWGDLASAEPGAMRPFELRLEAPLRVMVDVDVAAWRLRLLLHHAACDGVGAVQFLADLLIAYDHRVRGAAGEPAWNPLDPQRLLVRDEFGLRDYRTTLTDAYYTAVLWTRLLFRRAAVMRSPAPAEIRAGVGPFDPFAFGTCTLSAGETDQLSQVARSLGVTVNDLLLRDLFLELAAWNAGGTRRPLRITVPTNLRLEADAMMPAANVLAYAFLERRDRQLHDAKALLRSVHDEMVAIKQWRLGLFFIGGLRIACALPALMRWALRRNLAFATAVFSNLGTVLALAPLERRSGHLVCGDSLLESLVGVPPIRPNTRLSLSALSYAGRLAVMLLADPQYFSQAERDAFLQAYLARVRETISSSAPEPARR